MALALYSQIGSSAADIPLNGRVRIIFGILYWYLWTILLPRLQGYKLEEETVVLKDGISITTEIVEGDPEEMIERRAEAGDVDLIVVGHRDVTRVRRWLEGSTSETLVKKSKTSVLVVRDGDEV